MRRARRKHLNKVRAAKLTRVLQTYKKKKVSVHFGTFYELPDLEEYRPPELVEVDRRIQDLINNEKKRIRQSYLTTRTGKSVQDAKR